MDFQVALRLDLLELLDEVVYLILLPQIVATRIELVDIDCIEPDQVL